MEQLKILFLTWMGKVEWTSKHSSMPESEKQIIKKMLAEKHYIILTWRKNHLSSYFISLAHFLMCCWAWVRMPFKVPAPKFGRYAHACFNVERTDDPRVSDDFKIVEAVGRGVVISGFDEVFNCTRAVLLEPDISSDLWQLIVDRGLDRLGTMYDFDLNIVDETKLSCIELVHYMLRGLNDFDLRFAEIRHEIHVLKNLDPQMYRDSSCFRVAYETPKG